MNGSSPQKRDRTTSGAPGATVKRVCGVLLIVLLAAGCGIHHAPDPSGAPSGKDIKKEQK